MKKKEYKHLLLKIFIYFVIFMTFFCGSLFFIKNNMHAVSPYSFDKALEIGQSQIIDYYFCGILMRRTFMNVNIGGALLDLTFKDYPIFYIMPFIIAALMTIISAILVKLIRIYTKKIEL
ncbi:hypothetical protein [Anaerosporobacter faecicola]|uniref:hypothetical protein n=1 Tax=Anaerosporobacter faecicola TaxID=2718714 RepID=UPI001439F014|nr:hypothetical protein [Anaerosporobacter faecicola]